MILIQESPNHFEEELRELLSGYDEVKLSQSENCFGCRAPADVLIITVHHTHAMGAHAARRQYKRNDRYHSNLSIILNAPKMSILMGHALLTRAHVLLSVYDLAPLNNNPLMLYVSITAR